MGWLKPPAKPGSSRCEALVGSVNCPQSLSASATCKLIKHQQGNRRVFLDHDVADILTKPQIVLVSASLWATRSLDSSNRLRCVAIAI